MWGNSGGETFLAIFVPNKTGGQTISDQNILKYFKPNHDVFQTLTKQVLCVNLSKT